MWQILVSKVIKYNCPINIVFFFIPTLSLSYIWDVIFACQDMMGHENVTQYEKWTPASPWKFNLPRSYQPDKNFLDGIVLAGILSIMNKICHKKQEKLGST